MCQSGVATQPLMERRPQMNATTYGLDIAKREFQMYWGDAQTGEIANRKFGRDDLIAFLAQRPAGRIALEACGSAHWWARKIRVLGHDVVLLLAKFIRPFVKTNKTDAANVTCLAFSSRSFLKNGSDL